MRNKAEKMASDSTHSRKGGSVSSVQFGAGLFGTKTWHTVNCLIYFILMRDVQSIIELLNGQLTSYAVQIGDGIKRQLDTYDTKISQAPILLAMALQNSDAVKGSMTQHATPADITATLLDNIQRLKNYADSNGLKHPTLKEIQAFANKLPNVEVGSVLSLMIEGPEFHRPGARKVKS